MRYTDFNLQLRGLNKETDKFEVAVLPSSEIEGTRESVLVIYGYDDLSDGLYYLEKKDIELNDLIDLGKKLANRLFPEGKVRELFQQAIDKAGSDDGVRLRLLINESELAQIPWEFAYLPIHGGDNDRSHFLVLNPKVSMVRHEVLEGEYPALEVKSSSQLRLVAAMANVKDTKYSPLKLDKEKTAIEEALQSFKVDGVTLEKEVLENTTVESLQALLAKKADLFHFAGHGEFTDIKIDPNTGKPIGVGSIVLLKDATTRASNLLSASKLAPELAAAGVRVVVLGACKSGRRDGVSAWTGVAPALIEKGIPAVVAMQYEVNDTQAIAFSRMFYTCLAAGLSIDEAVAAGRRAMSVEADSDQNVEWGVPVLYMRSRDGVLFPRPAGQELKQADELRLFAKADIESIKGGEFRVMKLGRISKANEAKADLKAKTVEDAITTVMEIDEA